MEVPEFGGEVPVIFSAARKVPDCVPKIASVFRRFSTPISGRWYAAGA
jgi:hypothetical protein